jgi:hypothetical protein
VAVREATSSKSPALRIVSNGGLEFSCSSGVLEGRGLSQSSVMVRLSTVPFSFEGSRLVGRTEGAWMEE